MHIKYMYNIAQEEVENNIKLYFHQFIRSHDVLAKTFVSEVYVLAL
jgi:hypothetical protein